MSLRICPDEFLHQVRPALADGDPAALAERVRVRWTPAQLCRLLQSPRLEARRTAALIVGLVGDRTCVDCLVAALHDNDAQVNEMAEHGLWSIWFRSSTPAAAEPFHEGVAMLSTESYDQALDAFDQAILRDPTFAEAYNQRSITHFLSGDWDHALADAQQAVVHMPAHFGAISGIGHCYMHLGELNRALEAYQRALAINPRMRAIQRAVRRLKQRLHGTGPAEYATSQPLDDR